MGETLPAETRFRIVVAYCGEGFDGWQSQVSGNGVQDHLLRALRDIHPGIATVQGSGRTDAGVHALAQVAHFDVPADWRMDGRAWREALNNRLPPTLRIMEAAPAPPGFHARFSATGKTYRYEIFTGPVLPPGRAFRAWHLPRPPDPDKLRAAAAVFRGRHDFSAFAANRGKAVPKPADPHRTLFRTDVIILGDDIHLEFEGDGFLYKMVRLMTGAIVRAGQGKLAAEEIGSWLADPPEGRKSPVVAPPDGLYLVSVRYD